MVNEVSVDAAGVIVDVNPDKGVETKTGVCKIGPTLIMSEMAGRQAINIKPKARAILPVRATPFMPFLIGCGDLHELRYDVPQHSLRQGSHLTMNDLAT